ncbi:MAG TPA: MarR family transcriptional regulator [Dermatophilaceae bacterium]
MTHRKPTQPALLLYMVKQLELAIRSQLDDLLKGSGVTALQYTALTVLERTPFMSSADLARASFVRAQSTAELIGALERRRLIERHVDPNNHRRLLISLTHEGGAFLAEYDPRVAELEEKMLTGLTSSDHKAFRYYLGTGHRNLSQD